jgi:hypothetical protein
MGFKLTVVHAERWSTQSRGGATGTPARLAKASFGARSSKRFGA